MGEKYKVIVTSCWEFNADSQHDAMEKAKGLANQMILPCPGGDDFENYKISLETVKLKRNTLNISKIKEFKPQEVYEWLDAHAGKLKYSVQVDGTEYIVKVNSDKYKLFREKPNCAACGMKGCKYILEYIPSEKLAYFNFYGEEGGRNVLMTKDHIVAKAYGGSDSLDNMETCCSVCNQLKASYPIGYDGVKVLRDISKNQERLPTKELRKKISDLRLTMLDYLNGQ